MMQTMLARAARANENTKSGKHDIFHISNIIFMFALSHSELAHQKHAYFRYFTLSFGKYLWYRIVKRRSLWAVVSRRQDNGRCI